MKRTPYGEVEGRQKKIKKKKSTRNEWSERWAELSRHLFLMEKENANVRFIFSSSSSYSLFSLWSSLPLPSLSLATKFGKSFAAAFFFLSFLYIHIVSVVPNHNFFLCLHDRTSYSFLTRTRPKEKKFAHSHTAIKQQNQHSYTITECKNWKKKSRSTHEYTHTNIKPHSSN